MVKNRFSMIDDLTNDHTGSSKKFSDPFNFANVDVSDVRILTQNRFIWHDCQPYKYHLSRFVSWK